MESPGHNRANISPPNCNKMLIFGKKAFFIMLFTNILTNPIFHKFSFCDVNTLELHCSCMEIKFAQWYADIKELYKDDFIVFILW